MSDTPAQGRDHLQGTTTEGGQSPAGWPRWVKVSGIVGLVLLVLVVLMLLLGGHGPGRHRPQGTAAVSSTSTGRTTLPAFAVLGVQG